MRNTLLLIALVFHSSVIWALDLPSRDVPARCAEPCGGTLFLCGGEECSDEFIRQFVKLAGGDKAQIVLIAAPADASDAATTEVEARWRAQTKGSLTLARAGSVAEANRDEFLTPLRSATGIWLLAPNSSRFASDVAGTKLIDEFRALVARDGALGGCSDWAAALGDLVVTSDSAEKPALASGLGVLKDLIFVSKRSEEFESQLNKTLVDYPGRVGVSIDDRAALVARGRELKALGESTVLFHLAASATRPARTITIQAGEYEDLTALRRAALDRAGKPFPAASPKQSQVASGSLVIVGGGRLPVAIRQKFLELSGGPEAKMVVIPIASNLPQVGMDQTRWLKELGAKNVVLFDPQSRSEAESAESLAKLKDAGGIWFGGGRQWRTVDRYEGTACVAAFHDVLRRGGAIGGSSAGATIQGEYLVRGSPLRNTIMMAEGYERGFAFLPGAAIDQHFTQRKRQPDMVALKQVFPQLLGLGLDEGTAVIVHGTAMEVLGEANVTVYPPQVVDAAAGDKPEALKPLILKAGESLDLDMLTVRRAPPAGDEANRSNGK